MPSAPTTAPVTVPTVRGPAVVSLPATHPRGAANALLTAMRCHNAGISPSFWRALATASDMPRATAPTSAAPAAARIPRCAAKDAPARPPTEAANPMEELLAMRVNLPSSATATTKGVRRMEPHTPHHEPRPGHATPCTRLSPRAIDQAAHAT